MTQNGPAILHMVSRLPHGVRLQVESGLILRPLFTAGLARIETDNYPGSRGPRPRVTRLKRCLVAHIDFVGDTQFSGLHCFAACQD